MQYMHHDFISNFEGSVNSGDVDFSLDLWTNEVSDLIVHEQAKVIDLLNKINITAKETDSAEELADKILNNIGNVKLNRGISFLIGESNKIVNKDDKDWKSKIDNISNAYQGLLKNVSENPAIRESVKTDLMQHIKSKVATSGMDGRVIYEDASPVVIRKKRNKKILLWTLVTIGGIALVWYLVHEYKKGSPMKLADGGNLGNANPNPINTPPVVPIATPKPISAPITNPPVVEVKEAVGAVATNVSTPPTKLNTQAVGV